MSTLYFEPELTHHGVKGMKWGVRRTPKELRSDRKIAKSHKRHVAADKRNLRSKNAAFKEGKRDYDEALYDYRKSVSRPYLSRKKKMERTREASDNLTKAGNRLKNTKADLLRAERVYDADAKKYADHINKMLAKYGDEEVKSIRTKTYKMGEDYTKELIRTGITVADMPVIGPMYSGRYTSKQEARDRRERLDESASKMY